MKSVDVDIVCAVDEEFAAISEHLYNDNSSDQE